MNLTLESAIAQLQSILNEVGDLDDDLAESLAALIDDTYDEIRSHLDTQAERDEERAES